MSSTSPLSSSSDETTLVTALRKGDYRAFEMIYRAEFTALHRYAASLVTYDDAIDAVQDVFFSIWNNHDKLQVHSLRDLRYYLFRAVRNRAYKINRHYTVRHRYDQAIMHDPESIGATTTSSPDDSSMTSSNDLAELVQQVIPTLPVRSREILTLRWYHNLAFDQIAQIMGISYSYAHVLHSRALAMVRARLGLG